MLTAVALAAAVAARVPWPVVGFVALATMAPLPAAAMLAVAVVHAVRTGGTRIGASDEAAWLAAVAAELRGGASLRIALCAAAADAPAIDFRRVIRLAGAGAAIDQVAAEVARVLPRRGSTVGAALSLAGCAGGRAAAVFERLAGAAWDEAEALRQRSTLTAQARLSAWIVGGLPVVAVAALALSGRLGVVLASGPMGAAAMGLGMALELAGLTTVLVTVRRVGG